MALELSFMRLIVLSLAVIFLVRAAQATPPTIDVQPEGQTNIVGGDVWFEVDATSDNDLAYQWYKNRAPLSDNDRISGATDFFLQISAVTTSDAGNYSVTVSDVGTRQAVTSANAYLRVLIPPAITQQPASIAVTAGSSATFTVKVAGTTPFGYQWLVDGVEIPGTTNASLTLPHVQPGDDGNDYSVVIVNLAVDYGLADAAGSDPATLTVLIPPTITDQPESVVAVQGDSVLFSVEADGTDTEDHPMTYQWLFKGKSLIGETDSLLEVLDVQPSDAGAYSVVVTVAGAGSVTSSNANLTVNTPPVFTLHPQSRTATAGSSVTFTATATGTLPMAYQWHFEGTPIAGATQSAYTFHVSSASQAGNYSVVASNIVDDVDSRDAYLTVVAETVKPTVAITAPLDGARWSNAVITVRGTAADNAAVQNVEYQFNGGAFVNASTTNNWTNWTATFPAIAGTNQVRAVATDTSNNRSVATPMRKIFYVVPSPLTLLTNGLGTITLNPVVKSNVLEIGRGYTLTATPGAGCGFVTWDGGLTSTNRILSFLMSSNLMLRANFRDITKPTVTITSPSANARLTNTSVTFQGTAKDNFTLDHVEYQLNGSPFAPAIGTSNWSAVVNLKAGTNVFQVKSVDTATNESLIAARNVFFVVPSPLTLCTNGSGRITGATNGQWLEIGRNYKVTATPDTRNLFAFWSVGSESTNPVLNFMMQSNLMLCANFVTNPFVALKGTYYGLFAEMNAVRNHDRSGSFTLTLAEAGTYSASFQLGAKKLSATGKFDWLGRSWLTWKQSPTTNVTVAIQLDVTNLSAEVVGTASNEFWTAPLLGYRPAANLGSNSIPQAGRYTAALLHTVDSPAVPGGDGFGTITLTTAGLVQFSGMMADGTPVTQSAGVSPDGQWPFYANLYSGKGSVLGWGTFTNCGISSIKGDVSWIKMPVAGKFYPNGFNTGVQILGSHYAQPPRGVRVLNVTTGEAVFTGGGLTAPLTNGVFLTTNNTVTVTSVTNKLALAFTLSTGKATGSFTHPVTKLSSKINGVMLPEDNTMSGFFLSTNLSGAVILYSP
jgi:hypothetical protein